MMIMMMMFQQAFSGTLNTLTQVVILASTENETITVATQGPSGPISASASHTLTPHNSLL